MMNVMKRIAGVFITYMVCYSFLVVGFAYLIFTGKIPARNGFDIVLMFLAGVYTVFLYQIKKLIKIGFDHIKEFNEMIKEYEEMRADDTEDGTK